MRVLVCSLALFFTGCTSLSSMLSSSPVDCSTNQHVVTAECIDELGLTNKLEWFTSYVHKAKNDLNIEGPVCVHITGVPKKRGAKAWVGKNPAEEAPCNISGKHSEIYVVQIVTGYMAAKSLTALEYVASHEICHIVMGHTEPKGYPGKRVGEAEVKKCVYKYVGHKRYIDYALSNEANLEFAREYVSTYFREMYEGA